MPGEDEKATQKKERMKNLKTTINLIRLILITIAGLFLASATGTAAEPKPLKFNRDLNATILHSLGIDHERFTFKFRGLNQRLTGVEHAHVIKDILA